MKETVLDVLLYIFENYIDDDSGFVPDQEMIREELAAAGFPGDEIERAFVWIEGLGTRNSDQDEPGTAARNRGLRVFTRDEMVRLDRDCRGYLLSLEQMGVLDAEGREMVIDRVMALESDDVDLEQLKWVALMVLFNQPGQEASFGWKEDLVIDGPGEMLH